MRAIKDESGQVLPWAALLIVLFAGAGGLCIDVGHAYICYRELQLSTDAAALAGAREMAQTTSSLASVKAAASNYSASGSNVNPNLPNPTPAVVNLSCNETNPMVSSTMCAGSPTGDNIIQVSQSVTVPTYFIKVLGAFGFKAAQNVQMTTTSTAVMQGAQNAQYNIALLIDTTASMGNPDSDTECSGIANPTQEGCALAGAQQLLLKLKPCTTPSNCASTQFDTVSLFVFPNLNVSQTSDDTTCPTTSPGNLPYYSTPSPASTTTYKPPTTGSTYQVTNFGSNYLTNGQSGTGATINANSPLGIATGANCSGGSKHSGGNTGLQTPGGDGTYLPGAIYQAGAALAAQGYSNTGSKNALVILSDGNATGTSKITPTGSYTGLNDSGVNKGTYPSSYDQCTQEVTAAQWVTKNVPNTTVYTIAFGSPTAHGSGTNQGCSSDASINPCQAMAQMSTGYTGPTNAPNFYSDSSHGDGTCIAPNNSGYTTLEKIFTALQTKFTQSRLIPNSVWGS